jgi:hypothetical protein
VEPVSTVTLLTVAGKLGPPTVQVLGTHLAARLSPGESKRLRRALAEVVLQVSHEQRPSPVWHPFEARRWRKAKKRIDKELRPAVGPEQLVSSSTPGRGNAVEQATSSWREGLAMRFRDAASAGLGKEPDKWSLVLGTSAPSQWGEAVQRGLEWRMAVDPKLRQVLARLDWGSEQASREAAAFVSLSYLKVIPVALALASGIFLALVAIAVVLAIN